MQIILVDYKSICAGDEMTWQRNKRGFLHKSMLNVWKRCPFKYKCWFIDEIPHEASIEMMQGRSFHLFAKTFFDKVDLSTLDTCKGQTETERYMLSLIKDEYGDNFPYCEQFALFEANRYTNIRANGKDPHKYYKPLVREFYFEDEKLHRAGAIDRIDLAMDDRLVVIDYKPRIGQISDLRSELVFYLEAVNSLKMCPPYVAVYIGCYAYKQNRLLFERVSPQTKAALSKSIMKMQSDHDFVRRFSDDCVTCWFNEFCVDTREWKEWENETRDESENSR